MSGRATRRRVLSVGVIAAVVGAAAIIAQVAVYAIWLAGGEDQPTPPGPTPWPSAMSISGRVFELASPLLMVVALYVFVIRPRAANSGRITSGGLYCLASPLLFWQDPLMNYFSNWMTYNANLVNLGSWANAVPGWEASNSELMAIPLLWILPAYVYAFYVVVLVAGFAMSALRWFVPGVTRMFRLCVAFTLVFLTMLVGQPLVMYLTGMWGFPGAHETLTIFRGRYYQFPIYEAILWGLSGAAWAALIHSADATGLTVVERRLPPRWRGERRGSTLARFLAVVGATNTILFALYYAPMALGHRDTPDWPSSFTANSYYVPEMCDCADQLDPG